MSEAVPREPDVCPRCGAHVEALMSHEEPGTDGRTQRRECPSCGAGLVREAGEPWRRESAA